MNKEDKKIFMEDLLWTSYRYCIGRHTYVSSLAKDMGDYFYDELTDERKIHIAEDIRSQIEDRLHAESFNFSYDWSVPRRERRPLEHLLEFINSQDFTSEKDLIKFTRIEAYKKNGKLNYETSKTENPKFELPVYEFELLDYLPWADLASLFDIKNHHVITVGGKEYEAFESYVNDGIIIKKEGNMCTIKSVPWKYNKVYKPVSEWRSSKYIELSVIENIK